MKRSAPRRALAAVGMALDPGVGPGARDVGRAARRAGRMAGTLWAAVAGARPRRLAGLASWGAALEAAPAGQAALLVAGAALGCGAAATAALGLAVEAASWAVGAAAAQSVGPGDFLGDGMETRAFLGALVAIGEGGSAALGGMFRAMNLALVFVAGIALVYMVSQAVLDTARGGRPGASGIVILRAVAVLGLLFPAGAGFGGAQYGVLWLAETAGAGATKLWSSYSADVVEGRAAPVARPPEAVHRKLVGDLVVAAACMEAANREGYEAGFALATVQPRRRFPGSDADLYRDIGLDWRDGKLDGACGVFQFGGGPLGSGGEIFRARDRALRDVLPEAQRIADDLVGRLMPGGSGGVYGEPLPSVRDVLGNGDLAGRFVRAMENAIVAERARRGDEMRAEVEALVEEQGWLAAPLVFQVVARTAGELGAAVRAVPTVAPPAAGLEKLSPVAAEVARKARAWVDGGGAEAGGPVLAAPWKTLAIWDVLSSAWSLDTNLVDPAAPLGSLAALGHSLVAAGFQGFAAIVAAATGSNFLEAVPFIGKGLDVVETVWSVLDGPITTGLLLLIFAGLVLAYLVPLIPFMRFLFGLAVWLFEIVEALIGVALWLVSWLTMDKDRLLPSNTRDGLGLLLGLALRPALMVVGLLLALVVAAALLGYLNRGFGPLMEASAEGMGPGPVGRAAILFIYCVLAYVAVNMAFSLVDRMPSGVLGWMGARLGAAAEDGGRAIVGGLGRVERMGPRLAFGRGGGRAGAGGAGGGVRPASGGGGDGS